MPRTSRLLAITASAGAAVLGAPLIAYTLKKQRTLARLQNQSHVVATAWGPIDYGISGTGPAILISHGSAGGYDQSLILTRLINSDSYTYLLPSRFGYLRTPLPETNATPRAQADVYATLLDALNIPDVAIIGLSSGGASALQFALHYPQRCRALILLSAVTRPIAPPPAIIQTMLKSVLRLDLAFYLACTYAPEKAFSLYGITPQNYASMKHHPDKGAMLQGMLDSAFPMHKRRPGIINDFAQAPAIPTAGVETITAPTLVIHGQHDRIIPPDHAHFIANTIPGARLHLVAEGGHFCFITHMEQTRPLILDALHQPVVA
jgi:pimeloyl-ACP methyl ester carboxylesterase